MNACAQNVLRHFVFRAGVIILGSVLNDAELFPPVNCHRLHRNSFPSIAGPLVGSGRRSIISPIYSLRNFIARSISSFQKFRANKAVRIVRNYDEEEGRSQPRGKWLICCLFFCKAYWRLYLWESFDVKPSKHCCLLGMIRWAYGMLFCWKLGEAKLWNVNFWVL